MGNASSSGRGHNDETVDLGYLTPQGIYTGPRDWNQSIVTQLIVERRLAPFYRPLEDYEETWDDEQVIANMKEPPPSDGEADSTPTRADSGSVHSSSSRSHHKRPSTSAKEPAKCPAAALYKGAAECPICFLYYPSNINHSRCCDQAICTECFVQIKRADPTATHLVSEPASCPYCVQENFGIVYTPPSWRTGINSDGWPPPSWTSSSGPQESPISPTAQMKRRRKSFGADSPEVVTTDHIRPDWEAKLAAVRAAVARRANRRIVMRQVGDRLIPVGITSGRIHALQPEEAQEAGETTSNERGSRRSRRRNQNSDLNQYLGQMGLAGPDLEELMVMEAMRLSLLDHEEQQRKQREEERKQREGGASGGSTGSTEVGTSSSAAVSPPPPAESAMATSPTTSPTLLSPGNSDSGSSGTRIGHRSSSSLSRLSLSLGGDHTSSRRSPSPLGVLGAAMRSAVSTASAVASPPPEARSSSSIDLLASPPLSASIPGPVSTVEETRPEEATPLPPSTAEAPFATPTIVEPPADEAEAATSDPARPISHRNISVTSSIDHEPDNATYDVLPSTPGSSVSSFSHKPLLDMSPSLAPQTSVPGSSDSAPQTG